MAEMKCGTVELSEGVFIRAEDVKLIQTTLKGNAHCCAVLYGVNLWESGEMTLEEARKLASEINERVNESMGTTPAVIAKSSGKTKRGQHG